MSPLAILAALVVAANLALLVFQVVCDHHCRQREKRSREIRSELLTREQARHEEIRVIGSGRTARDLFADRRAA